MDSILDSHAKESCDAVMASTMMIARDAVSIVSMPSPIHEYCFSDEDISSILSVDEEEEAQGPVKSEPTVESGVSTTGSHRLFSSIPNKKRKAPSSSSNKHSSTSGRWTLFEHETFLLGVQRYGREWKRVAHDIPTRSPAQVRSHAQKYFNKVEREIAAANETLLVSDERVEHDLAWAMIAMHDENDFDRYNIVDTDESDDRKHGCHRSTRLARPVKVVDNDTGPFTNPYIHGSQPVCSLNDNYLAELSRQLKTNQTCSTPSTVQQEIDDTLSQLRTRHCELQKRLAKLTSTGRQQNETFGKQGNALISLIRCTPIPSDEELALLEKERIAVHVLRHGMNNNGISSNLLRT